MEIRYIGTYDNILSHAEGGVNMQLIPAQAHQLDAAMEIIDEAKRHLRDQGIDQWQTSAWSACREPGGARQSRSHSSRRPVRASISNSYSWPSR